MLVAKTFSLTMFYVRRLNVHFSRARISLLHPRHILWAITFLLFTAKPVVAQDWIYTVRQGDTLWDLCLTYTDIKNCWQKIGPYNDVEYPRSLAPGTRVRFPVAWLKTKPVDVEIIYVSGNVQVTTESTMTTTPSPKQPAQTAKSGDRLAMGSHIQTGEASTASLKFADGSVLVLEPNSHIVLDTLSQHGNGGMVDTRVNLLQGTAKSQVKKHTPSSRFRVSTPSAVAAVRGTDFRISTSDDVMLGEVFEGAVDVSNPASKTGVIVAQAYGIKAEKGRPISEPKQLLNAPVLITPQTNQALPFTLEWQPIASADHYKVELLATGSDEKVLSSNVTTQTTHEVTATDSGCYRLRVSAIDTIGLQGMPTQHDVCGTYPPEAAILSFTPADSASSPTPLQLSWSEVAGAKQYLVEVSDTAKFNAILHTYTTENTLFTVTDTLPETVYVRVTTIAEYGVTGQPSNSIQQGEKSYTALALGLFTLSMLLMFL